VECKPPRLKNFNPSMTGIGVAHEMEENHGVFTAARPTSKKIPCVDLV
jgi:hypothetical protein